MLSQVFKAEGPVDEIRSKLDNLAAMDKVVEGKLKKVNKFLTVYTVISVILFIAMCIGVVFLMPLLLVSLVVLLLPALIIKSQLNVQNLEDRKIETGRQFFSILNDDIPGKKNCSVYADFQGYQRHGKLVSKKNEGFLASIRHSVYVDCWFLASGALHDGNVFKLSIVQTAKRTEKSKRKYTKVAEALREKVKLLVKIDRATYPKAETLTTLIKPSVSVAGLNIRQVAMRDSVLRITADTEVCRYVKGRYGTTGTGTESLMEGKKLIALFLYLYGHLQKCR